jgi:hypothetical protein
MNVTTMYCSGCDREVPIVVTDAAGDDAQANVTGSERVCLGVGTHCTESLCPLGTTDPAAMVHRLIRHGLPTEHLAKATGACDACGLETEFALVGETLASCLVCGTTRPWERTDQALWPARRATA